MTSINCNENNLNADERDSWSLLIFGENSEFLNVFQDLTINLGIEAISKKILLVNTESDFHAAIKLISNNAIIHIDCSNHDCNWLSTQVQKIRRYDNAKHAYITIWTHDDWQKITENLIDENKINELRASSSLSSEKVNFIIQSNFNNQCQIIELLNLKDCLESQVNERTESLTRLNKKLQAAIIQNSNINTKLHQQKMQIEHQNEEMTLQNLDLEKAFKKSSKQHVKLFKVLQENESQRHDLEKALQEIQQNNHKLQIQNEEIVTQNEHIAQQREEIESQRDMAVQQHHLISEQQNEIKENITYARRIQNAMLTPENELKQFIPNHFVLNKPKDIVSGDFYWVAQNRNYTIIAVADCTGHGISGAMMSMLGTAFLNEIVNNNDVVDPALILQQLRDRIIVSLHQEYSHDITFSRDGMDISIGVIDIMENNLIYSGANNPIYIFRNNELIELKPDKMPIGIHEFFKEPFTNKKIELQSNDTLYLFSDGYADQFGGAKGKKLKYNQFKKILQQASSLNIKQQKHFLNSEFEAWKGEHDQIDDVIVLGYQIS